MWWNAITEPRLFIPFQTAASRALWCTLLRCSRSLGNILCGLCFTFKWEHETPNLNGTLCPIAKPLWWHKKLLLAVACDQNKLSFNNSEQNTEWMKDLLHFRCVVAACSFHTIGSPIIHHRVLFILEHQQKSLFRLWKNWTSLSNANSSLLTDIK